MHVCSRLRYDRPEADPQREREMFCKCNRFGFAFCFSAQILPIIFFFSFIISILYYLGAMQFVVQKLGWILQTIIGTTVCESVTCAANIFLGMSESPLLIRPYIRVGKTINIQ